MILDAANNIMAPIVNKINLCFNSDFLSGEDVIYIIPIMSNEITDMLVPTACTTPNIFPSFI